MTDPELLRIRGYLQGQAARLTILELVAKVRGDLAQVRSALDNVPAERLGERPRDGEWSANEVAAHLASTSREVARGITTVLDSGKASADVSDRMQPTAEQKSAAQWADELEADREELFARVGQASGEEYLDQKWRHPMFGDLNWREWVLFTRIHDLDHARQVQAIAEELK